MRMSYGDYSNALKILGYLSPTEEAWAGVSIGFWHSLLEQSRVNPGLGLKILPTDGLYVFYKNKPIIYMHFRKKHFLCFANEKFLVWGKGDRLFGKASRQAGSWQRQWRLNTEKQVEALVAYLKSFKIVHGATLKRSSRSIPAWVREFVKQREDGKCKVCGTRNGLHFDHVYPFSWGGGNDPKNIQLLCSKHNLEKSASLKY